MGKRKSKQAGGNMPLTHYERTKKFKSSEYGTTEARVAGHSQYQVGVCGLSLTSLQPTTADAAESVALCTPSGHFYEKAALLEYLLTKTQEIKDQFQKFQAQEAAAHKDPAEEQQRQLQKSFEASQKTIQTKKMADPAIAAKQNLHRTSYWLADAQPDAVSTQVERPPERPPSPHSGQPLRRKELWPIDLVWENDKLVCSASKKAIHTQEILAYWTTTPSSKKQPKEPGHLVLASVYRDLGVEESKLCPTTGQKIRHVRKCRKGGSSFAGGSAQTVARKYRPTIT